MGNFVVFLDLPVGFFKGRGYMNFNTKFLVGDFEVRSKNDLASVFWSYLP